MCATVSWGAHEFYMHPIFVLKNGCDRRRPHSPIFHLADVAAVHLRVVARVDFCEVVVAEEVRSPIPFTARIEFSF
jgi:hypothetical protein